MNSADAVLMQRLVCIVWTFVIEMLTVKVEGCSPANELSQITTKDHSEYNTAIRTCQTIHSLFYQIFLTQK